MAINPQAIDRLIALGRRQGFVTTGQIDQEIPVERMSETEIAEIVDRLERAGVPVELDEALMAGEGGAESRPPVPPTILHLPEDPPADPPSARPGLSDRMAAPATGEPQPHRAPPGAAGARPAGRRPAYVLPAIAAVAILVLAVALFVF